MAVFTRNGSAVGAADQFPAGTRRARLTVLMNDGSSPMKQLSFTNPEQAAKSRRHAAREVPGRDGSVGAMVAAGISDRAAVPDERSRGPSAHWGCQDAAHVMPAAVVRAGRRGARRRAVRHALCCASSWASTWAARPVPDATTLLKFRRLLNDNDLTRALFDEINAHLAERGLLMRAGTIVDATIIAAPPSTKNKDQTRDPGMHQTKKGNQWHFGMKAHIAVDADSGLVLTVIGTAANVNDVTQANALLHGQEVDAYGDAGYQGAHKRDDAKPVNWHVALRPGKRRALDKSSPAGRLTDQIERVKASIRAKVEHPFHVIKNLFGHKKVPYKGLAKNTAQLHSLFTLANLLLARRRLFALDALGAS